MQPWKILPLLILGLILTACSAPAATPPPTPAHTVPAGMLPTSLPATPALPTAVPTETPSLAEPLDGQTSFAVIAAVQGNIATIELWLAQGLSVFERQAVVGPLAETAVAPLGDILQTFIPQPDLAESWAQAADLQAHFYPALQSWIAGEVDDEAFGETLAGIVLQAEQALAAAEEIARTRLGVDTALYGPDYTLANDVVFELSPLIGSAAPESQNAAQEAPELVVQTLAPFTYSFAGTEIFTVVGILENTGSAPQTDVQIEVRFFDDEDTLLGITSGVLSASAALPGRQYPFSASTITQGEEKHLLTWTRYETRVLARTAATSPYQDLTFTADAAETTALGEINITGTLTNSGEQTVPVGEVFIGAAAYDSAGILVGVGSGSAYLLAALAPGASTAFEAYITALNGEPASYQFFGETQPGE